MIQSVIVGVVIDDPSNDNCSRRIEAALSNPNESDIDQTLRVLFDKCVNRGEQQIRQPAATELSPQQSPRNNGRTRLATDRQIAAIEAMAKKQGFDLRRHLHDELGASSVSAISIKAASGLIDHLKGQFASG